jgi:hypothetical protein
MGTSAREAVAALHDALKVAGCKGTITVRLSHDDWYAAMNALPRGPLSQAPRVFIYDGVIFERAAPETELETFEQFYERTMQSPYPGMVHESMSTVTVRMAKGLAAWADELARRSGQQVAQ